MILVQKKIVFLFDFIEILQKHKKIVIKKLSEII